MDQWYIVYNGKQIGPMQANQLPAYNVTANTLVWKDGMKEWQPAYNFPELMQIISQNSAQMPPTGNMACPPPQGGYYQQAACSDKNHTTAGILALLIGGLGIHYFYIGKTVAGLLTILLSFATCGLWGVVTLIQAIMMLTMTQEEFDRKYVYSTSSFPLF